MILFALFIGVVLIIAAVRNSQGALFTALGQDVPGFVVWAAAILALGAIGWVPGLKPISRGLLGLVLVVLIFRNYQGILNGFQQAWTNPPKVGPGAQSSGGGSSGGGAISINNIGSLLSMSNSSGSSTEAAAAATALAAGG